MVDVAKVRAALDALKKEVTASVNASVKSAEKNPLDINGIGPLVKINQLIEKAEARIGEAVDKTTPKPKKEKEDKKK